MLITTVGVQQQMNASTMRTVILSVLALALLKWVDLVLRHLVLDRKNRFWDWTNWTPSEILKN